MKLLAIISIMQIGGGFVLYPPLSSAQNSSGQPSEALKVCIIANAPAVEQTFPSLNEGADFLTQKICAMEIGAQAAEEERARSAAMKKRMDEWCETAAKSDNDADESGFSAMCGGSGVGTYLDIAGDDTPARILIGNYNIPGATSLAAQTLMKLRIERQKKP